MLALHLLQICLVYINTLMIQRVLTEPDWTQRMLPDDLRALMPLIYVHVTSYGTFRLDMNQRLAIEQECHCCLTSTFGATLPLVTRMFLLGLDAAFPTLELLWASGQHRRHARAPELAQCSTRA